MSGFFSTPSVQPPPPPPPPPARSDREIQDEALRQRRMRAGMQGRASTILTSGQGAELGEPQRKTLLGE